MHGVESFKIIKQSSWYYTLFKIIDKLGHALNFKS